MSYTHINDGGATNYTVRINKSNEEKQAILHRHSTLTSPMDKNLSPKISPKNVGKNNHNILTTPNNNNLYISTEDKQSPKGISIENTNFFQKFTPFSRNTFVSNMRFVRDSFFEPLNDNYETRDIYSPYLDSNSNNNNNSIKSPKYNSPNNSSSSSSYKSPKSRSPFSNLWKSFTISPPQDVPVLQCEDDDLLYLTRRMNCVSTDLNILWNDAKVADDVETKRLMRRLQQSGLF
jgi:hypothetical protein